MNYLIYSGLSAVFQVCIIETEIFTDYSFFHYVQAAVYCAPGRAKKVIIGLTALSLILGAILVFIFNYDDDTVADTCAIVFMMLPLTILIVNVVVGFEVNRSSRRAAAILGRQQSAQAASSNSTVPTVMLITTSLIYVLLCLFWPVRHVLHNVVPPSNFSDETLSDMESLHNVALLLQRLIFYNFCVYLVTGKQFRSKLRSILCCCCKSSICYF